ncbi:hypothetical protein AZA_05941 [Nitrospirillum viridazoti Y2]|nr:hypothetical protein AZA_05941 [Nitrospirillum amazonense Y2]
MRSKSCPPVRSTPHPGVIQSGSRPVGGRALPMRCQTTSSGLIRKLPRKPILLSTTGPISEPRRLLRPGSSERR